MGSSIKPIEVIFAGSSQSEKSTKELESLRELYPDIVRTHLTAEKCTAGQNRNRGWEIARGEYISFCDADDLYSPKRLEVLQSEIHRSGADLIIHDYLYQLPLFFLGLMGNEYRIVETKQLFDATFPYGRRNKELEFGSAGESNILMPPEFANRYRVQHGHATVKSSVKVRYSDYPYAEDGIFCRDVLFSSYQVIYLSAKLSIYESLGVKRVITNAISRTIFELAKFKKWLGN